MGNPERNLGRRWGNAIFVIALAPSVTISGLFLFLEKNPALAAFSFALFGLPVIFLRWLVVKLARTARNRRQVIEMASAPSRPSDPGDGTPKTEAETVDSVPAGSFRFIAIDVETANSDAASICQFGFAVVDEAGNIKANSVLVDPQDDFEPFNTRLHGIGPDDVVGAPTFDRVLEAVLPLLRKNQLVQHSSFDKRAIEAACVSCGLPKPHLKWHDSVEIARKAWPELTSNGGHGLMNLKKNLDLDFKHHDAGEDARAAAMVVLRAEAHTGQAFYQLSHTGAAAAYPETVKMDGNPDGRLFGQVAVFTGRMKMKRREAARLAAGAGNTTKAAVSKKVTLLVVGDQDLTQLAPGQKKSTKHRKAEELIAAGHDIRIMAESDFLNLVKAAGNPGDQDLQVSLVASRS